jgi:acetyl esterase/lipase
MGERLLVLDYRLAPEHPFPAAMEDATAAYHWLIREGWSERRIAIGGDSAGGGLTLQTLLSLREAGGPLPAVAFLLSPITDWIRLEGESYGTRARVDPLITRQMCQFTAGLYVGNHDPEDPLLSPTLMDLSGLPPMCIHVGDCEVMLSDSLRLARRARDCGVILEMERWPGMWHVFQSAARFVPEGRESLRRIGEFVSKHLG